MSSVVGSDGIVSIVGVVGIFVLSASSTSSE
jgi:hypothetical protein